MALATIVPNESTATTLIAACHRGGGQLYGLKVWRDLEAQGVRLRTPPPYNAALACTTSSWAWKEALHLVLEMHARKVRPDRLTCSLLLRTCEQAKRYVEAVAVLPLFRGSLLAEEVERLAGWLEQRLQAGPALPRSPKEEHGPDGVRDPLRLPASGLLQPIPSEFLKEIDQAEVDLQPLRAIVQALQPGADLWPVGSYLEGLRGVGGDVDATIILKGSGLPQTPEAVEQARDEQRQILRRLRPLLVQEPTLEVQSLVLSAKRPIMQLTLPGAIQVDLSVENRTGFLKSAYVVAHLEQSPAALRQACFLLKSWAKRRRVYGQKHLFPSGLAFACLAIFAAQRLEPPMAPRGLPLPMMHSPWASIPSSNKGRLQEERHDDLLQRLLHFTFRFYAEDFKWDSERVCIRSGHQSPRLPSDRAERSVLSIQDPVETNLDLAWPYMNERRSNMLKAEFCRATRLTSQGWSAVFSDEE